MMSFGQKDFKNVRRGRCMNTQAFSFCHVVSWSNAVGYLANGYKFWTRGGALKYGPDDWSELQYYGGLDKSAY